VFALSHSCCVAPFLSFPFLRRGPTLSRGPGGQRHKRLLDPLLLTGVLGDLQGRRKEGVRVLCCVLCGKALSCVWLGHNKSGGRRFVFGWLKNGAQRIFTLVNFWAPDLWGLLRVNTQCYLTQKTHEPQKRGPKFVILGYVVFHSSCGKPPKPPDFYPKKKRKVSRWKLWGGKNGGENCG